MSTRELGGLQCIELRGFKPQLEHILAQANSSTFLYIRSTLHKVEAVKQLLPQFAGEMKWVHGLNLLVLTSGSVCGLAGIKIVNTNAIIV